MSNLPREYRDMAQLESLARTSAERFIERMDPHEAPAEKPLTDCELLRTQGTLHDMLEQPSCVELRHLNYLVRAMFYPFLEHAGLVRESNSVPDDYLHAGKGKLGKDWPLGPPCRRVWVNDRGYNTQTMDADIPLTAKEYAVMPTDRNHGYFKVYPVLHPHLGFLCPLHRYSSEKTYYKTTGGDVSNLLENGTGAPFSTQLIHQVHALIESVEGPVRKLKQEHEGNWEFRYGHLGSSDEDGQPSFVLRKLMDDANKPCIRSTLFTEIYAYGWRE